MGFASEAIGEVRPLRERLPEDPFLPEARDGEPGAEVFDTWPRQDRRFVETAVPFPAGLPSRCLGGAAGPSRACPRRPRHIVSGFDFAK